MTQRSAAMGAQSAPARGLRDIDLRGQRQVIPLTLVAALGVGAIWLVDVSTGPEYGFAIFYLIPIGLASWWLGRYPAMIIALLSTVAWIFAEAANRVSVPLSAVLWNGLTRAAIFIMLGLLIDQVRRERTALRSVDMHREESLALVAHTLRRSAGEIEAALPDLANAPALSAAERDAVLDLRRQSRNFNRFAEDVLEVGQLETGHFRLNRGRFDLSEFVATLARETDKDRLQLVSESDPVWVEADPERLRTAIEHLLNNALRFSPPGSTVHLTVSGRDARARVTVKDQGVGLARSHLGVLFKKYGRVEIPENRERIGVGLGLYVARLIAEAHGGTITASSVGLGLGSTFVLELPLAEPLH
ncbi:MAG: HAMP domain-containing histidine kinase [Chloroflexi bacterium]|nr:MAG: HAMP domain-containing histidine kinase [Chloroflexota bacterium]TMF25299.1 MAG: HAMP domain-containing histidine kinase [Chloroflexota bacterium]